MFCNQCGSKIPESATACNACNATVTEARSFSGLQTPQLSIKCPYCREDIQIGAIKCKHCGEFLVRQQAIATTAPLPARDGVAAVLSFFIPGLGQMYHGRIAAGLLWLIAVIIGYALMIIPGIVLHVVCISLAYSEHKV